MLLIHPKLQKDVHHAPSTTIHAAIPPSEVLLAPQAGVEVTSGSVNNDPFDGAALFS